MMKYEVLLDKAMQTTKIPVLTSILARTTKQLTNRYSLAPPPGGLVESQPQSPSIHFTHTGKANSSGEVQPAHHDPVVRIRGILFFEIVGTTL